MSTFLSHSHVRGRTVVPAAACGLLAALFLSGFAGAAVARNAIVTGSGAPGSTASSAAVLSFTATAQVCFTDDVEADFAAGGLTDTYVSVTDDGEVILAPASGAEWSGAALPGDWTAVTWSGGGSATVGGGTLTVDGQRVTPLSTTGTGAGVVLEFVATFGAAALQHVGLGAGDNTTGSSGMFGSTSVAWAMFSTHDSGTQLHVRVNSPANPGENVDLALGAAYLGAPHRYRIEWKSAPDSLVFSIDGASVARQATAIAQTMRPGISDFDIGGPAVVVDWIRGTPFAASGTFTSRVYDAGSPATWDEMTWTAATPAGTGLSLFARTGDTPVPDGTWTAFTSIPSSGSVVGGTSRYVQYRADLTTSDPDATPVLEDVTIACVPCDPTPPAAVTDLAATRATSGGAGGRIPIVVTFSAPPEAAIVEVWRAPFGGYPDYDDGGGSAPATPAYPPAAPWTLTAVTASGQSDDPPSRDAWYYVVFTKSVCDTVSAVSNMTAGVPNYLLGDVSDGVTVCSGDNAVTTADVSLLGSHYGAGITGAEAWACLDVGPTEGDSVNGRPLTDRVLQFEDLVIFALNYGASGVPAAPARATRAAAGIDGFTLEAPARVAAGETFDVVLRMSGSGAVQAISASLEWNASVAEPVGVAAGDLLASQGGVLFAPGPGRMDAALLGVRRQGLAGEGVLAVWTFRAHANGEPAVAIGDVDARDAANRRIELGAPRPRLEMPSVTAFERVSPNPFAGTAMLEFSLAAAGDVSLAVYSVDGRRVRTLARGAFAAGRHQIAWNGAAADGRRVGPGLYFARLECGAAVFTRSLVVVR